MAELTVAKIYGRGLFLAAEELGRTEVLLSEAGALSELFERETELFRLLSSPVISKDERRQVIRNIFEGRLSPELINLLYLLIDKNRGAQLPAIIKAFFKERNDHHGYIAGLIDSPVPLTEEQLQAAEEKTGTLIRKRVKLENRLDPSLIGGFRIFVDGKLIDTSVKKRLSDLAEDLLSREPGPSMKGDFKE